MTQDSRLKAMPGMHADMRADMRAPAGEDKVAFTPRRAAGDVDVRHAHAPGDRKLQEGGLHDELTAMFQALEKECHLRGPGRRPMGAASARGAGPAPAGLTTAAAAPPRARQAADTAETMSLADAVRDELQPLTDRERRGPVRGGLVPVASLAALLASGAVVFGLAGFEAQSPLVGAAEAPKEQARVAATPVPQDDDGAAAAADASAAQGVGITEVPRVGEAAERPAPLAAPSIETRHSAALADANPAPVPTVDEPPFAEAAANPPRFSSDDDARVSEPASPPPGPEPTREPTGEPTGEPTAERDTAVRPADDIATAPAPGMRTDTAGRPAQVTTHVNMRAGPDNDAAVLAVVPAGDRVDVIDCEHWCEVRFADQQGWIYKGFIGGLDTAAHSGG